MADIQVNQIKYLGQEALGALWEKISATYLRQANTETALTNVFNNILDEYSLNENPLPSPVASL